MDTPVLCLAGPTTGPSNSAVRYIAMAAGFSQSSWQTAIGSTNTPFRGAGTIASIRMRFPVAITTGSYELALMVGGAAVATGTITTGNTLTIAGPVSIADLDLCCWRLTPTGTPDAQTVVQISYVFTATTSGKSIIFASHAAGTAAQYMQPGAISSTTRTDANTRVPMPTPGVIDGMAVSVGTAPGVGNSRIYTLYKNGSSTALTVTISGTNTTGNMTGAAISFANTDVWNLRLEITGTPASTQSNLSLDWAPTTDGEFLFFGTQTSAQSTAAARTTNLNGGGSGSNTTESDAANLSPTTFSLRKLFVTTDVAPGAGKSRTCAVRLGGVTQSLSAAIADTNVAANDGSNSASIVAGDIVNFINTPAGTPAANAYTAFGVVGFIAPSANAPRRRLALLGVA